MNNKDLVILAENQVHNIHKDHKNPFELAMSSIWVINATGEMTCRKLYGDVYELLDSPETLAAIKGEEFFGVLTSGWAAPIDECDEDTHHLQQRKNVAVCAWLSRLPKMAQYLYCASRTTQTKQ